jgi:hypothetical protein
LCTVGDVVDVERSGTCSEFRWKMRFGSLKSLGAAPLLQAKFSPSTTGFNKYLNVTRFSAAHEVMWPLPGLHLRVPVPLANSSCQGYSLGVLNHQRNFSVPVVVSVNGLIASCSASTSFNGCLLSFNSAAYPVVLSVIPNHCALISVAVPLVIFRIFRDKLVTGFCFCRWSSQQRGQFC